MSTTLAARSSSPRRQAGLILEASASAVSLILLGWLLLWFILYPAGEPQIHGLFVRSDGLGVLFQENDVRSLAGDSYDPNLTPSELKGALEGLVRQTAAPSLIYVSAPALGIGATSRIQNGPEPQQSPTILDLIQTVAEHARGDVLLALDCGQVGSDRELGIFGNSPYQGLEQAVRSLKPEHRLAVLISCSPGEISLIHNGEGRSLFAVALQHALNESATGPTIGVTELFDKVSNLVGNAAIDMGGVQTPRLIAVGAGSSASSSSSTGSADDRPFQFQLGRPRIRPRELAKSGATTPVAKEPEATSGKTEASEKPAEDGKAATATAARVDPSADLIRKLGDEWVQHETLRDDKAIPALIAPVELRRYEAALRHAELLVRQAIRDDLPSSIRLATDAVAAIRVPRDQVAQLVRDYRRHQGRIPFQPIANDQQQKELISLLNGLGQANSGAEPIAGKGPNGGPPDEFRKELAAARRDADSGGFYPSTHLELQLPLWALVYSTEFGRFAGPSVRDAFQPDRNAARLLRAATLARIDGERALDAVEFGGLDWIRREIEQGDRVRREVQDQLFDPVLNTTGAAGTALYRDLSDRIVDYQDRYKSAYELANEERSAMDLFSRSLYDLPVLAERKIRGESSRALNRDAGALPREVVEAIQAAVGLSRILEARPSSREGVDVSARRKQLRDQSTTLREKRDALEKSLERVVLEERIRGRLSWVSAAQRRKLLEDWDTNHPLGRWVARESRSESPGGLSRSYWNEAVGLALLDATIRAEFSGRYSSEEAKDAQGDARALAEIWSGITQASGSGELGNAWQVLAAVREHAWAASARLSRSPKPPSRPSGEDDRRATPSIWMVSFRRAAEVDSLVSKAWWSTDPFTSALLQFHADRLRLDYVPELDLESPTFEALPNPFAPRIAGDVAELSAIGSSDTPTVRVEFRLPRPGPQGRKAILAVGLTEEPTDEKPSFTLKDPGASAAEGSMRLSAIGPRDDSDAGNAGSLAREFRLGRTGTTINKAERILLECRTFFSGLIVGGSDEFRRSIAIRRAEGEPFRIVLGPNEVYLRKRYDDTEIKRIQEHYRANNKSNDRYVWYGQPFHYTLEIARKQREAPPKVWVKAVLRTGKEPREQEIRIQKKTSPHPLLLRAVDEPTRIEEAEPVRPEDIPGLDEKGEATLEIRLYEEEGSPKPFHVEAFSIRSVRMYDCLSFNDHYISKPMNVLGKDYEHGYMLSVCRNKRSKNLVSEPINGNELGVTLFKRAAVNNREEPFSFSVEGRTDKLWPSRDRDECIDFKYGLYLNDRPTGYSIDYLGYNGTETAEKDGALQKRRPLSKQP